MNERQLPPEIWRPVVEPLLFAYHYFRYVCTHVYFGPLVQGAPAILLGLVSVYVATLCLVLQPTAKQIAMYAQAYDDSIRSDPDAAELWSRRLIALRGPAAENRFRWAEAIAAQGKTTDAWRIMASLADPQSLGYLPAHAWLARELLKFDSDSERVLRTAELHIRWLLERNPKSPEGRAAKGALLAARKEYDAALPYLRDSVDERPDLLLPLAEAYLRRGNRSACFEYARQAAEFYGKTFDMGKKDPATTYGLARSFSLSNRPKEAVDVLREATERFPEDRRFRRELAVCCVQLSDVLLAAGDRNLERRAWALLEEAIEVHPPDLPAIGRLVRLAANEDEAGEFAREALKRHERRGRGLAALYWTQSQDAWTRGEFARCRELLEKAVGADPTNPLASNSLAWALVEVEPYQPNRAYRLIDDICRRWPDQMVFRHTKGKVLHRLGRYEDALGELEPVLREFPHDPRLRRVLASVYRELGSNEMADRHDARAEQLEELIASQSDESRTPPIAPNLPSESEADPPGLIEP